jgi:hypothetical protein
MHVAPVDDEAAPAMRVVQRRADGPRLAVRERRHRVEEVRHARDAVAEGFAHFLEGAVGVSRAHDDTGAHEGADRRGRGELRGQRDEGAADGEGGEERHALAVEVAEFRRIVRALAQRADERAFDVQSDESRNARGDRLAHRPDRARDHGEVVADERRQEPRRAIEPMRRADPADGFDARGVVEEHAAAAVHLAVDEAGHEARAAKVMLRGAPAAWVAGVGDGVDARSVEQHHAVVHETLVEQDARVVERQHVRSSR